MRSTKLLVISILVLLVGGVTYAEEVSTEQAQPEQAQTEEQVQIKEQAQSEQEQPKQQEQSDEDFDFDEFAKFAEKLKDENKTTETSK
jgi:Tfp pilus assembly protein PilO